MWPGSRRCQCGNTFRHWNPLHTRCPACDTRRLDDEFVLLIHEADAADAPEWQSLLSRAGIESQINFSSKNDWGREANAPMLASLRVRVKDAERASSLLESREGQPPPIGEGPFVQEARKMSTVLGLRRTRRRR